MNTKTLLALGELVQEAAHAHGVVGPVEFRICAIREGTGRDRLRSRNRAARGHDLAAHTPGAETTEKHGRVFLASGSSK